MDEDDIRTRGLRVGRLYNSLAILLNKECVTVTEAIAASAMLFVSAWTGNGFHEIDDDEDLLDYLQVVAALMAQMETEVQTPADEELDHMLTNIFGGTPEGEA